MGQSSERNNRARSSRSSIPEPPEGASAYTVIQFLDILQLTSNPDKHLRIEKKKKKSPELTSCSFLLIWALGELVLNKDCLVPLVPSLLILLSYHIILLSLASLSCTSTASWTQSPLLATLNVSIVCPAGGIPRSWISIACVSWDFWEWIISSMESCMHVCRVLLHWEMYWWYAAMCAKACLVLSEKPKVHLGCVARCFESDNVRESHGPLLSLSCCCTLLRIVDYDSAWTRDHRE